MHEYDLIADWYASDRESSGLPRGLPEVTSLASSLAPGARVLDIGCGTGGPLPRALLSVGLQVVGIDSSMRMLERFRVNCPSATFIHGAIQSCDLDGMTFDAAIAWGVFFHLEHSEQPQAIAQVSSVLKAGGRFLFTSGDQDGGNEGTMNGVLFRYWSFTIDGYRRILQAHGLELTDTHADAGGNVYYLAVKKE